MIDDARDDTTVEEQIAERSGANNDARAEMRAAEVEGSPEHLAGLAGADHASRHILAAQERLENARNGALDQLEPEPSDVAALGWPCVVERVENDVARHYEYERGARVAATMTPLAFASTGELPSTMEQARWLLRQRIQEATGRRDATNMHRDLVAHVLIGATTGSGLPKPPQAVGARGLPLSEDEHREQIGDLADPNDGLAHRHMRIHVPVSVVIVERGTRVVADGESREISP